LRARSRCEQPDRHSRQPKCPPGVHEALTNNADLQSATTPVFYRCSILVPTRSQSAGSSSIDKRGRRPAGQPLNPAASAPPVITV
jgi:hypothetical protein